MYVIRRQEFFKRGMGEPVEWCRFRHSVYVEE